MITKRYNILIDVIYKFDNHKIWYNNKFNTKSIRLFGPYLYYYKNNKMDMYNIKIINKHIIEFKMGKKIMNDIV